MNDVTQTDILEAVRESAMLADVSISTWGGTRTNAKLLNEVKIQHGATGDVGKLMLNVLAGADTPLKKAKSTCAAVRLRHYEMTLPWVSDPHATRQEGPRLLPHMLAQRYIEEMSALKRVAMQAIEEFLAAYPTLIQEAQANLNTLAGGIHYPTVDELRGSFRISFDITPIPEFTPHKNTTGRGIPLDDFMLERLTKSLDKKQQHQVAQAQQHIWERAAIPVKRLIDRLTAVDSEGDGNQKYFKSSTIESLRELLTLLPGWNVTGNPQIDELTEELRTLVDGLDIKVLKTNEAVRADVVRDARKVADKLTQWGV